MPKMTATRVAMLTQCGGSTETVSVRSRPGLVHRSGGPRTTHCGWSLTSLGFHFRQVTSCQDGPFLVKIYIYNIP